MKVEDYISVQLVNYLMLSIMQQALWLDKNRAELWNKWSSILRQLAWRTVWAYDLSRENIQRWNVEQLLTNLRFRTAPSRVHPKIAKDDSKKKKEMQISSCSETEETKGWTPRRKDLNIGRAYQIVGRGY